MTSDTINDLYHQSEEAISNKSIRKGLDLLLKILEIDFTNDPAWRLLHNVLRKDEPFESFQFDLATKYFPNKVQLLLENELNNLVMARKSSDTIQGEVPTVNITHSGSGNAFSLNQAQNEKIKICQYCNKQVNLDAIYCSYCGSPINNNNINAIDSSAIPPNLSQQLKEKSQVQIPAYTHNDQANTPIPDENSSKKTIKIKYRRPIAIAAFIFIVLLFIIPFTLWLIASICCVIFFLWKLEILPKNVRNGVQYLLNNFTVQGANIFKTIINLFRKGPPLTGPNQKSPHLLIPKSIYVLGLVLLMVIVVGIYIGMHKSHGVDFCNGLLDCSQATIRSQELCNLSPDQRMLGIEAMYILQVDLITPTGGQGRSESIVATKKPNGWSFSEDYWNPSLTCSSFLN
jgi:hypothetical protein